MTEIEVFLLADKELLGVIEQIKPDQWGIVIPQSGTNRKECTLREKINYHTYDEIWVPEVLAGKTIQEVGTKFDGDLLGDDPIASYRKVNTAATGVVKAFSDLDKVVHLSYGDFSARDYFKHITSFRGLQAWDLAKVIELPDYELPADLAQGMWDEFYPDIEDWRKMGAFPAPIAVPDGAPIQDKILGLTGRNPRGN